MEKGGGFAPFFLFKCSFLLITVEPVERYRFAELVIRLSCLFYANVDTGFRSIRQILMIINEHQFKAYGHPSFRKGGFFMRTVYINRQV